MTRKTCPKCGKKRMLKFFGKCRQRRDGLTPHCLDCRRAYQREYAARPENKARRRAYAAEWYIENREAVMARTNAYRRAHLAQYASYQARYREEHPEYMEWKRAYARDYTRRQREGREAGRTRSRD